MFMICYLGTVAWVMAVYTHVCSSSGQENQILDPVSLQWTSSPTISSVNISALALNGYLSTAGTVLSINSTGQLAWTTCTPNTITTFSSSSSLLSVTSDTSNENLTLSLAQPPLPISSGGTGNADSLVPFALQYALNSSQQTSLSTGSQGALLEMQSQTPSWATSFNWSNLTLAQALSISDGGTGITESLTPNTIAYAASNTTQSFISPGVFGQVLESTGPDSPPSWTWGSSGALRILSVNWTSGEYNFTFPSGTLYTYLTAIGGGGGSGRVGAVWGTAGGYGGGGGGLSYMEIPGPISGTIQISVGAGGQYQQNGGDTVIGNFLLATGGQANGGQGGQGFNYESNQANNGGSAPYPQGDSSPSASNMTTPAPAAGASGWGSTPSPYTVLGGVGGSIVFHEVLVSGGAAGPQNGYAPNGQAGPAIVLYAGAGAGSAGEGGYPGSGGLYGGGAGGVASGQNSMGTSTGGSGFAIITVFYVA